MELLEIAKKRHSVRKYTKKEIEQEKLNKILEAAHVAPTAANMQPVRLLVVKSKDGLEKSERQHFSPFPLHEFFSLILLITLHGLPTATQFAGISFVTTLPAPITVPSPMDTPGRIIAPPPIQQPFPIFTGNA